MPMIDLQGVTFSYDGVEVLGNVALQVEPGEFVGVMGPNGGGKTTLLKVLMGFLKPESGTVKVAGRIGYVPQTQRVDRDFPITVEELIELGDMTRKRKGDALMERLGLLPHRKKVFGSLSGGLMQKALLARALLSDPDILFLDEPTANIDAASTAVILELLESFKGKKTILMVTHDLKTIVERVNRVICVQHTVSSYLPKEICEHFALGLYHAPLVKDELVLL